MSNMPFVIWIIGWIISLLGIMFMVKPSSAKWVMRFVNKWEWLYIISATRIILAVVYFLGAQMCRIPWVIILLGIILLISGIIGFTINLNKLKSMVNWWEKKPKIVIRIVSVIIVVFGVVTVYSALR